MRAVKVLLIVLAGVALILAVGVVLLDRYVRSAPFKQAVLDAARDALGADVAIGEVHASLFSGVALRGVTIANPPGFRGDLLTADALVVRYRLLPLLRKRLELSQVSLERPVLRLVRGDAGQWNYEKVGAPSAPAPSKAGPRPPGSPEAPPPTQVGAPLDVVLPKLAVTRGEVLLLSENGRPLARFQGLDLASSATWGGHALSGSGRAGIETINVADRLFVRRLDAPISFSASEVRLAPLRGTLAGGDVQGDLTLRLSGGARYVVNLEVRNADVGTLLAEADARRRVMSGRLQARVVLEGTGGLATVAGTGRAEVVGGRVGDVPLLSGLAAILQVPGLRDLQFEECRLEFALARNVLETPVIRLISRDVQITGRGSIALASASLDHNLTLALAKDLLDRVPREVRRSFTDRPDGLRAIDVRVWGPYDAPRTDLADRLLDGVSEQLLRKGLRRLFR